MRLPVNEQNRKRRAVQGALKRHQEVFRSSTRFRPGLPPVIRVLIDGSYYDVAESQFDLLSEGRTPRQLGLEPVDEHGNSRG